jgi:hypothetical protein
MTEIQENYKDYEAPRCVLKSVKRLIRNTPTKYFFGLQLVHLTNTDALNRKNRRKKTKSRKRKVALNNCAGWYVEKWNNQPARIELLVDKIFYDYPSWALKIGFVSDIVLSRAFFHELGHHIHKTQAPEHEEREDVAEKWKKRLSRKFFWKRYWHFMVLILPFKRLLDWLLKRHDEKSN